MKKLFILFIAVAGFGVSSYAQPLNATTTSSATIVKTLSITRVTDLNFGSIASDATNAGTVTIGTDGVRAFGGLGTSAGNSGAFSVAPSAATFTVAGTANATYGITVASRSFDLTNLTANGGTLTLSDLKVSTTSGGVDNLTGTIANTGTQTLYCGATLAVPANSAGGLYRNTTGIDITVAYE